MWELDCEESWVPKNWCFWSVVLEKTLESPLDCKEIQPVHSEGDQPWVFSGRNDAKAETPVLWPPHEKSWLIGKDSDAGRDWGQEEKGMTEDEMAGWHHRLDGHEFGWTLGVGDGQGGLACCDSWGHKSRTWLSHWTELISNLVLFQNNRSLQTKLVEVMEFQLSFFKSSKIILWKCFIQHASKFGKLSSGHRTGKYQFAFKFQRKAMLKNFQTTDNCIPHTLVK